MNEVITFWFEELEPADWFRKSDELDQTMRERFFNLYEQARRGELYSWRRTIEGRLAEILLLDQIPRNIFRDQAQAFATDGMALVLAQEALEQAHLLEPLKRSFLYMPFMHSESLVMHELALKLFDQPGLEKRLRYERAHAEIIRRFGRYPYRNAILGRVSTADEEAYLAENEGF